MIRILILVTGAILVAAALAWKARAARLARAGLDERLRHPEPEMRTNALRAIGNSGLRPWAPVLLSHLDSGMDEHTLRELAARVAANQWEPADDPGVVRLRTWAADYHLVNGNGSGRSHADGPTGTVTPTPTARDDPKPALVLAVESILGTPVVRLEFTPAG